MWFGLPMKYQYATIAVKFGPLIGAVASSFFEVIPAIMRLPTPTHNSALIKKLAFFVVNSGTDVVLIPMILPSNADYVFFGKILPYIGKVCGIPPHYTAVYGVNGWTPKRFEFLDSPKVPG
jgi:hypothetical protein